MNDLLTPAIRPLATHDDRPRTAARTGPGFDVVWARHASEVHEAQRLRYRRRVRRLPVVPRGTKPSATARSQTWNGA